MNFNLLPDELYFKIFNYVDNPHDCLRIALVSSKWRGVAFEHPNVTEKICRLMLLKNPVLLNDWISSYQIKIKVLDAEGYSVEDKKVRETLAQLLEKMPHLKTVKLSQCNMGLAALKQLQESLLNLPKLKHLDLEGNNIRYVGATTILKPLAPRLKSLNIKNNPIAGNFIPEMKQDLENLNPKLKLKILPA